MKPCFIVTGNITVINGRTDEEMTIRSFKLAFETKPDDYRIRTSAKEFVTDFNNDKYYFDINYNVESSYLCS